MATGDVHTTYDRDSGQWVNRREGNVRPSSTHDTAADASARGQDLARGTQSEWYKHAMKDARIQQRNTYGSDPFPPRDTK